MLRAGQDALRHLGIAPDPALLPEADRTDDEEAEAPEEAVRLSWSGEGWTLPDLSGRHLREAVASLEALIERKVDVVTEAALHWYIRDQVLTEVVTL